MSSEHLSAAAYKRISNKPATGWRSFRHSGVVEHIERYRFAAHFVKRSKVVLDAACGSGWGTQYLATTCNPELVIGIDKNPQAIKEAKDNFKGGNFAFTRGDLLNISDLLEFPRPSVIVSFETVEHISPKRAWDFLTNLRLKAKEETILIISSPNGPIYSPYRDTEGKSANPFHTLEYTPLELTNLLSSSGWLVTNLYGQRLIDPEKYAQMAKLLHPLRRFTAKIAPEYSRMALLAVILLHKFTAFTDAYLHPL